ncbi:MAG: dihydroorotase [Omnitrophica WOR_2 bacterium RIFCSPHIGHO2_02_FULL_52_10]|nr:MAG: dihydroorotase [Omnitrophica WOR_2 bacterium RIFCSPHIGHO2_02_FULL_52_10]
MSLLIKNAVIVNADGQSKVPQDILIEKGIIAKIGAAIKSDKAKIIDARDRLVLPGLIDIHVHFREPGQEHKETIETGILAAAKGGFTTVMCMPNTSPVIDNRSIAELVLSEARRVGLINVHPIGAITKGLGNQELTDMFELKEAGCVALSDDGRCVTNSQLMRLAMEYAKMVGILLIQHCEDHCLSAGGVMNEGVNSTLLGLKGDPGLSESVIVARDIELAAYLDSKIHFAHMSLKRSVELIRAAKANGIRVTAEACPHHFTLTDDALKDFNTSAKVNPPLRTKEDIEAIKEALRDGTIDCIATDHAPHTTEDKEKDMDHAPCGMIGLETAVGLVVTELVQPKVLSWPNVAEKMSAMPAKIMGLAKKGIIKEGFDGDLTIIDPKARWTVQDNDFVSKSHNSPFIGRELTGRVKATICGGNMVYQD